MYLPGCTLKSPHCPISYPLQGTTLLSIPPTTHTMPCQSSMWVGRQWRNPPVPRLKTEEYSHSQPPAGHPVAVWVPACRQCPRDQSPFVECNPGQRRSNRRRGRLLVDRGIEIARGWWCRLEPWWVLRGRREVTKATAKSQRIFDPPRFGSGSSGRAVHN